MNIIKINEITLDTEESIVASTLSKNNEVVLLMSSGNVIRYNIDDKIGGTLLFSVKEEMNYTDGGFDLTAKSSIYTLDEIVVIVNNYKKHGFVHYPNKYETLRLRREDYHANISNYPIGLYKNSEGVPHLIYGVAWNHVQIMNLGTKQILTASKSLIEINAEEKHLELYKKYNLENTNAWPTPYDYFYGKLHISPDQKKFLSAGWDWGSSDCYKIYEINEFINSNRISDIYMGSWEHENRPTCWINEKTIATYYDPFLEDNDDTSTETPSEIHFYELNKDKVELIRKVKILDKSIAKSEMYFDTKINSFVFILNEIGIIVTALNGEVLYKNETIKINEYNIKTSSFLVVQNNNIAVYELN